MGQTKFIIFSDYFNTINIFKNKNNPSNIALLIQNKLDEAKPNKKQIIHTWIHGHIDIIDNEIVHKYARITVFNMDITILDLFPYGNFKNYMKNENT